MPQIPRGMEHGPDWRYAAGIDWRWCVRVIEGTTYCLVGAAYTFGPPWWHSSGNFYLINMLPIPFWVWTLLFFLGGVALLIDLYPYNWVTYFFLLIVSLFWGFAQLGAVILSAVEPPPPPDIDPSTAANPLYHVGGGGPFWVFGIAGFNLLFMMIGAREWGRARKQRKQEDQGA